VSKARGKPVQSLVFPHRPPRDSVGIYSSTDLTTMLHTYTDIEEKKDTLVFSGLSSAQNPPPAMARSECA
jgi:hypothetical protein